MNAPSLAGRSNPGAGDAIAGESKIDEREIARIFRWHFDAQTSLLLSILVIASLWTLCVAREVFLPIVLAAILNVLLSPLVRLLTRIHLPEPVGAGVVLAVVLAILIFAISLLIGPATQWFARAPETFAGAEGRITELLQPILKLRKATARMSALAEGREPAPPESSPTPSLPAPPAGLVTTVLSLTWRTIASLVITVVLLYFLLASGDLFLTKVVRLAPSLKDKKSAVEISRELESRISRYLICITAINAGLGTCVGLCQWLLGMPNPALWGALAFVLNFIPYLGGTVGIAIVAAVALLSFRSLTWALLPPLAYFGCFFIEGNFVTPNLMGRQMSLSPVIIFAWLTLWGWMWGVFGAFLAVPMLVILKIFSDHLEPLAPLSELLANDGSRGPGAKS